MKILFGKIVCVKSNKTVAVLVKSVYKLPVYGKIINNFKKYYAHDELSICDLDNNVLISQVKPFSKSKI